MSKFLNRVFTFVFFIAIAIASMVATQATAQERPPQGVVMNNSDWPGGVGGKSSPYGPYQMGEVDGIRVALFMQGDQKRFARLLSEGKCLQLWLDRSLEPKEGGKIIPSYVWKGEEGRCPSRKATQTPSLPNTLDKAAAADLAKQRPAFDINFYDFRQGDRLNSVPRSIQASAGQYGFVVPECFRMPVLAGNYNATLCIAYLPDRRFPRGNIRMQCQWATESYLHHPGYVCAAKKQLTEPGIWLIYERIIIGWR